MDIANKRDAAQKNIIESVGEEKWLQLDSIVQSNLLTSETCLLLLESIEDGMDFSSSIMPIMKALEYELAHRFYKPYLDFLKKTYSVEDYIRINNLQERDPKKTVDQRRSIILFRKEENQYGYCSPLNKKGKIFFEIGSYCPSIGFYADSSHIWTCDDTVIEFYKTTYFSPDDSKFSIENWILRNAAEVSRIVQLRNESAHQGTVQSLMNAKDVSNTLLITKKLIVNFAFPSLR